MCWSLYFRSKKNQDLAKLQNDISKCFSKIDLSTIPDINDLIAKYNISLTEIDDAVAPIQSLWLEYRPYGTATTFDMLNMKCEDLNGNAGSRVSQQISNCLRINALKCSNRHEL